MSINPIKSKKIGHFINGEETFVGDQPFKSHFPYTGEVVAECVNASDAEVSAAVKSAQDAFKVWSNTAVTERAKILRKAAEILRKKNDELAYQETLDTGRALAETSVVDIISGAECLEYFASIAETYTNKQINLPNAFALSKRVPLGVCVGIGAWNYPLQIACWKAAPALAMGNTMIFKPSELTPMGALSLAKIFTEAGLPPGVFNVLQGNGVIGQKLVEHIAVQKVSFTGSVPTGKKIMEAASATLKKVTLELGGKSPLIIFKDANLENAVKAAFLANFYSQGEICSNGTRVFVEESICDEFLALCQKKLKQIKLGDPRNPTTHLAPLINAAHHTKVTNWISKGEQEGALRICGGHLEIENAKFINPVIFTGCTDSMEIVNNEIFGPVMCVLSFKNEDEVIRRANKTQFGLAAGVFTQNIQKAFRVSEQINAGTCWINNYNITPVNMPFGGQKDSGMGKENGWEALDSVTQLKSYYVELEEHLAEPFA